MPNRQDGFTLIELLIVVAVVGVIAAIAVPSLMRARQSANEASAVGSLRAIASAQSNYAVTCASGFYSPTLENLGTAPAGGAAPFISPDLGIAAPVVKSGYEFVMLGPVAATSPASCNGLGANSTLAGYAVTATPVPGGGWRFFATNTSNTIWQHDGDLSSITDSAPPAVGTVLQ